MGLQTNGLSLEVVGREVSGRPVPGKPRRPLARTCWACRRSC